MVHLKEVAIKVHHYPSIPKIPTGNEPRLIVLIFVLAFAIMLNSTLCPPPAIIKIGNR